MKVSNNINVTTIYQAKLRELQGAKPGNFSKLIGDADSTKSSQTVSNESIKLASQQKNNVDLSELVKPEMVEKTPEEMVNFAVEQVANEPDIRSEKVSTIKALVDAGQYNVSPAAVAEKIWASGVVTHVW